MLHIVVCMKQVPDSAQIRVHPVTNTIMRQGVPSVINPYDLFALEEALRLKDKVGAQVTVLTMGPPMAEDSLRKALAYGADRAVLLTDRQFAGSDTLATTYALASAIRKIGETWGLLHVVFTGKQTIDGDTAQVGPGIAKRLNYNQLTYVSRIASFEAEAGSVMVERRAEGGVQVLTTRLPVLMTMLEDCNEIRRGTMDDALRAARAEIITWSAVDASIPDLGIDATGRLARHRFSSLKPSVCFLGAFVDNRSQITRMLNEVGVPGRRRGDEIVGIVRDALSHAVVANVS